MFILEATFNFLHSSLFFWAVCMLGAFCNPHNLWCLRVDYDVKEYSCKSGIPLTGQVSSVNIFANDSGAWQKCTQPGRIRKVNAIRCSPQEPSADPQNTHKLSTCQSCDWHTFQSDFLCSHRQEPTCSLEVICQIHCAGWSYISRYGWIYGPQC